MSPTDAALPALAVHPLVVEQLNDLILLLRTSGALPIGTENTQAERDSDPPSPGWPTEEVEVLREENAELQRELGECKIEIGRSRRALEGRARLTGWGRTEVGSHNRKCLGLPVRLSIGPFVFPLYLAACGMARWHRTRICP